MEAKRGSNTGLPSHAQVVIIGGGVIGCSTAYHLAKLGWKDVVILERKQLTSGTTWHAAGLVVCGGFATETLLTMAHYTRELYKNLEKETGVSTGFKPVGYIQAASSASRMRVLRKNASFSRSFGIETEEISPSRFKELWPLAEFEKHGWRILFPRGRTRQPRGCDHVAGKGRARLGRTHL